MISRGMLHYPVSIARSTLLSPRRRVTAGNKQSTEIGQARTSHLQSGMLKRDGITQELTERGLPRKYASNVATAPPLGTLGYPASYRRTDSDSDSEEEEEEEVETERRSSACSQ
jgi:hypothetical protein